MKISPSLIDTFIKASYSEEPPQSIEDFQLDKELATRKAIVYSNADGQAIVCNRGTAPKVADWMNNVAYVVGAYNWTDRMNQAIEVQKKVISKYGLDNITNIAHSQGCIITRKLNDLGLLHVAININPPITTEKQKSNEFNVRSSGDIVSLLSTMNPFMRNKKNITIRAESYNPITEHKSDILQRLHPSVLVGQGIRATNELTNLQIDDIMAHYGIPYHGCFIKTKLPRLLSNGAYVINLNGESHWTALIKKGNSHCYFDSFGFVPPEEVEVKIKPYMYNSDDIQCLSSTSCGYFCIAFIRFLHNKKDLKESYEKFLHLFDFDNLNNNELILNSLLC
jgi:hypothetical protein